jgi:hypothetical protein
MAEDDLVVERFTARGTHRGELMGAPGTGNQLVLPGINIFRVADDEIIERWGGSTNSACCASSDSLPPDPVPEGGRVGQPVEQPVEDQVGKAKRQRHRPSGRSWVSRSTPSAATRSRARPPRTGQRQKSANQAQRTRQRHKLSRGDLSSWLACLRPSVR